MSEPEPIRVLLVDDHAVVRSGLSAFLLAYDDLELVGEAGNGEEAVQQCEQHAPDVVLIDLVMAETAKRGKVAADDDRNIVVRYVPPESLQRRGS
jgi:DNA-binding NarL/FixJ family response regulator